MDLNFYIAKLKLKPLEFIRPLVFGTRVGNIELLFRAVSMAGYDLAGDWMRSRCFSSSTQVSGLRISLIEIPHDIVCVIANMLHAGAIG